jgi:hypothetical protein
MFGIDQLFCMGLKRSLVSILPWDIPWYDTSHTVFFMALYGALTFIGYGLLLALLLTLKRLKTDGAKGHH